jgi:hypothetical protein
VSATGAGERLLFRGLFLLHVLVLEVLIFEFRGIDLREV